VPRAFAEAFKSYRLTRGRSSLKILRVRPLPSLSVIIPTLNEAPRIQSLVSALLNQTLAPLEILVCDGDSDDDTARLAGQAGATVLKCERGTSRQRNFGARKASGELLVFLDADDLPSPRFLEQVARSFQAFPFAIACPWFVARDAGFFVHAIYFAFNVGFSLGQSTLRTGSGVCLICPRDKFRAAGGFDETMHLGEDVRLIRALCPRFGAHRHLWVPLETSGRRFANQGAWRLVGFYALISPLILLGLWKPLQRLTYRAAPYRDRDENSTSPE